MSELVLHPRTAKQLALSQSGHAHAIMVTGVPGTGKASIANILAATSLGIDPQKLADYPYQMVIRPIDGKGIAIEQIRELQHFLSLQVPSKLRLSRVVIIQDSHRMSQEAQNALLKTLEEPPQATRIIMTADSEQSLLPTIQSRVQIVPVLQPVQTDLIKHFSLTGKSQAELEQVYSLSGGLPGLMHAILSEDDHPLRTAALTARDLLRKSTYERLLLIDDLSKQKALAQNVCFILQQMARISLQSASDKASKRWQAILSAAYQASEAFSKSGQPKLILINLMVQIG